MSESGRVPADGASEAQKDDEIKRTGPPIPIAVRGSVYELSVALNATPSPAWRRLFQAPDDWTEPCHPSRITVKHRGLIFSSEEARVPLWISQIDKWIAAANQKYAQMTGSVAPREESGDARAEAARGDGPAEGPVIDRPASRRSRGERSRAVANNTGVIGPMPQR
jgi:hypothetical protein